MSTPHTESDPAAAPSTLDVRITRDGGSLFVFAPYTNAARDWIGENVPDPQWLGNVLVVESRYAVDLARGMADAGLQVLASPR